MFDGADKDMPDAPGSGVFQADNITQVERLIDILQVARADHQVTAGSVELSGMLQQLQMFREAPELSVEVLPEAIVPVLLTPPSTGEPAPAPAPGQRQVRTIKSQQASASREIEQRIQGIQQLGATEAAVNVAGRTTAVADALIGFGEQALDATAAELDAAARLLPAAPTASVEIGALATFFHTGKQLAAEFKLNRYQAIALLLLCRQLDAEEGYSYNNSSSRPQQLCQFLGGEGGTGKSRVIEVIAALFARRGILHRLLVTATSGTAAARINGVTIHSACKFSVIMLQRPGRGLGGAQVDGFQSSSQGSLDRFVSGPLRSAWQEKLVLVIDEVSMLGARTLYLVNDQLGWL